MYREAKKYQRMHKGRYAEKKLYQNNLKSTKSVNCCKRKRGGGYYPQELCKWELR